MAKSKTTVGGSSSAPASSSAASKAAPLTIKGYTVLPVLYPATPVFKTPATLYLYIRANAPAAGYMEEQPSEAKTLFVAGLPPDVSEDALRSLFGAVGAIVEVQIVRKGGKGKEVESAAGAADDDSDDEDDGDVAMGEESAQGGAAAGGASSSGAAGAKPNKKAYVAKPAPKITPLFSSPLPYLHRSSTSARITYLDALSLSRALLLPSSSGKARQWPAPSPASTTPTPGLSLYLSKHALLRPSLPAIKAHADSSLAHFEYLQAEERARVQRKGADIVDDDGFTLVVRGGRFGRDLASGGVGVASKRWDDVKEEDVKKKKNSKELKDFYRWQIREKKREDLADMRSKFQADQDKVEKLKASRRFKPY